MSGKGVLLSDSAFFQPSSGFSSNLVFEHEEEELCVRLRGRDLHTGDTKEQELCASPSGEIEERTYDSVRECEEPPPGYLERWCLATEEEDLGSHAEECEPYLNPSAGAGGSGGSSGTGGANEPGAGGTGSGAQGGGRPTGTGAASGSTGTGASPGGGSVGSDEEPSGDGGPASAGSPSDGEESSDNGSQRVLTERGCGCRTAGSDAGDSWLGGAGLAGLALGLALRRRRERRFRDGSPWRLR